jgi:ATP-dependent Clp protease ATP-binding subunit ClpC
MGGYVMWQLWKGPKFLIRFFWNVERMLFKYFSVALMLRTLVSHWHRDAVEYRGGFGDLGLALAWNAISRIIGLIVRTSVLVAWLTITALILVSGILSTVGFFTWPFVSLWALVQGVQTGSGTAISASLVSLILIAWVYERTKPSRRPGIDTVKELRSFHDLLKMLHTHPDARAFFGRLMIAEQDADRLIQELQSQGISFEALHTSFGGCDVFGACSALLLYPSLARQLRQYQITENDTRFVEWWMRSRQEEERDAAAWWSEENLLNVSGVGLSWAAGYTPFIDTASHIPRGDLWDVAYGHEEEVHSLITTLARRSQANVLVVGKAGTGRLGVIRKAARDIAIGAAHPALKNHRVVYIHIGQLLALGSSVPDQLHIIARALSEMERAGNIIAVLDGISSVLGGMGEGQLNATDILLPFFTSATVRSVIILSDEEYDGRIATNEELSHLFDVVRVHPLSEENTLRLLAFASRAWEADGRIYIPYQTLQELVTQTATILPSIPYPEKAFDVMEEAIADIYGSTSKRERHILVPEDVTAIISRKMGFDVRGAASNVLGLEDMIHERVVNQSEAIRAIAHAMIRARAGVRTMKRPIGTFLFLGPTGVGKTETAKALAVSHFGSSEYMVRLDMQQFQGEDGIAKLIGSKESAIGQLPSLITDHPFAVLLLDEFEKSSKEVQQLFLTILDEGYVKDAHGTEYVCTHMIIIATSNAGSEFIRTHVNPEGSLPQGFSHMLTEHVLQQRTFSPELLNRFDGVITFTPLSQEHIREVARRMLASLNTRLDQQHGVFVEVTDELIGYLVEKGFDPAFGARPMARVIQDTVEYAVSEAILKGTLQAGETFTIDPRQFEQTVP